MNSISRGLDLAPVITIDGDMLLGTEARQTAKRYYYAGFFALPWIWIVNIWLFFPHFYHRSSAQSDPVIRRYTRQSAAWFIVYSCLFLPWMLVYLIGGPSLIGQETYGSLDITNLDLASAGLASTST